MSSNPTPIHGSMYVRGAYQIELHCRVCVKSYTPTRADVLAGPEVYHRCLACRPPAQNPGMRC
jgi:hypothetical protein